MVVEVVNAAGRWAGRRRGVVAAACRIIVSVVLVASSVAADPAVAVVVAIDEGHGNHHTLDGRYAPFAAVLRAEGRDVVAHRGPFTAASLAGVDILVIANALAPENRGRWALPTPSAFSRAEVESIHDWVCGGGALFLIADHMPFAGAAAALADRFGVAMINGFVFGPGGEGVLGFSPEGGGLTSHPIVDGGVGEQPVLEVATFTGHAFGLRPGADAAPLLVLPAGAESLEPAEAWVFTEVTPTRPAGGLLQGAALLVDGGRVAVFAEAAMFTSQPVGDGPPVGFDHPQATGNRRFLSNVVRWLAGELPAR